MFYTFGISISFFLCLLLISKRNKTQADYLLSFWLCWIGFHLLLYYLFLSQHIYDYPFLLGFTIPMPLLHPALLYLYTATLCRQRLPKYWGVHFIPLVASYVYLIPFMLLPASEKIRVFELNGAGYEGFMLLINVGILASGLIYIFGAQRLLYRHRKIIAALFSYETNINLQWLQSLIYGMAGIWLAVMIGIEPLVFGLAVLLVMFIGYFGIRQVGIFSNQPALELAQADIDFMDFPDPETAQSFPPAGPSLSESADAATSAFSLPDKKKYEKSGLNPEMADSLHQRLQDMMTVQQAFRESELSLTDLAERLDTHPNYLSQIINERTGRNFYDYVNAMRVEAFLKTASEPKNRQYTLFALALECGFNSKTAFNRYFKKATGKSPSEYLETELKTGEHTLIEQTRE